MRQTKENLLKINKRLVYENTNLQAKLDEAKRKLGGERIRKEFAKAFSWYEHDSSAYHYNQPDPLIPTWEQIFVKIGSLVDRTSEANRLTILEERMNIIGTELITIKTMEEKK